MIPLELDDYFVYVLQNESNKRWHAGCTNNLRKRLQQHQGDKSGYTKHRGPYKLIDYEVSFNENDARAREKYLKTGMGKRYLRNRLKRSLTLTG